jgi:hypothetical protein
MGKRMGMMGKTENEFNPENTRTPCTAGGSLGAEDGIRTRDPHLGKVMVIDILQGRDRHLSSSEAIWGLGFKPFNTPKYLGAEPDHRTV